MIKIRILIADDHFDTVQISKVILESEHYHVDTVFDSESVLTKVLEEKPSLILLDMMLPKMGGLEVCRRLKQGRATSSIPVMMVTAKSDPEARAGAVAAGADAYLLKPFDPSTLVERVNEILHRLPSLPLTHDR
ncbi:MAG: response regulator [Nitrospirae bacterium]|nr:response regulator [Candidatus Manganitrophaceae bacterium]